MGQRTMTRDELDGRSPYEVLLAVAFDGHGAGAPGRIILQHCPDAPGHEHCVHWQNAQTGGRHSGGYHDALGDALEDFAHRVRREEGYARVRGDRPLTLDHGDSRLDFMATARFHEDLSLNGNDSLNLDDMAGIPGVIWDDWLFATVDDGTWTFESFSDRVAARGTYEHVAGEAYGYYERNR